MDKTLDVVNLRRILSSDIIADPQDDSKNRIAAVMIIVFGNKPTILMTERPSTMNHHAGEISFPGGTWERKDADLLVTAIRETQEELGLKISKEMVIGQLKPVTTLNSGFKITPFIAILDALPNVVPNSEIASILKIPLYPFLQTIEDDKDPLHHSILEMYTFKFENHLIWGASARMLKQIHDKIC